MIYMFLCDTFMEGPYVDAKLQMIGVCSCVCMVKHKKYKQFPQHVS